MHAIKALWTRDEAEFHGAFVDFERSWSWPKPLQDPHPPVYVGGMGPGVEDRILDFGDAWLAQGYGIDIHEFEERAHALQQRAADAGRSSIPISLFDADSSSEALEGYGRIGLERAIHGVSSGDRDTVLRELDELAPLVDHRRRRR